MSIKGKSYKQLQEISTAVLLEEAGHLKLILQSVAAVGVLIISLIIWAAFATIKESASTFGVLVPKGQVQIVQHLEGGIVKKVYVSNGDKVDSGQLLVKLDPTAVTAELQTLRGREAALILNSERLNYFINDKPPDVKAWGKSIVSSKYNTIQNPTQIASFLEDEAKLLRSQYQKKKDQVQGLVAAIERRKEKLIEIQKQKEVWQRHIDLLSQEFEMYNKLRKSNLISHKDYLVVLRELNRAKGEMVSLISQIEQTLQTISEAESKLHELSSDINEKALQELGTINDELIEVRHKIEKLSAQLTRQNIRSPVAGLIKGISVFAGNVITPGAKILEVVPFDRELVVESRVNPRDIGHIKVGDPVDVKVLTYDFARYGSIKGILTNISASTFQDEEGKPYYKATVRIERQYLGTARNQKRLLPGMTVEASVQTGQKTLLQYLLKPIHKATGTAFRER